MRGRFEASFAQYIIRLLGWIVVTLITLGIGGIWVAYDQTKWPLENASLGDHKITFTASFASYLGKVVLWVVVSLITLGIGAIWVFYDALKWVVGHIEVDGQSFSFTATFAESVGKFIIWGLVTMVTFGLGAVWAAYDALRWVVERSRYRETEPVVFNATFTEFIGKIVIWGLVMLITLGIGGVWVGYDYYRWLAEKISVRQMVDERPPLLAAA